MKKIIFILIKFYQRFISPFFGVNCRYHPTCSYYMKQAVHKHGILKGLLLGTRRLLSCHPYSCKEMHDPVPERFAWGDLIGYKKRLDQEKAQE